MIKFKGTVDAQAKEQTGASVKTLPWSGLSGKDIIIV